MNFRQMLCLACIAFPQVCMAKSAVAKFWNDDTPKNIGCGPGNLFFDTDSWVSTGLASSTNLASSPLLPTSTTSKASGCKSSPGLVENSPVYQFIAANFDWISTDAASGDGESLDALASLWGLSGHDRMNFKQEVQLNFQSIFLDSNTSPQHVYNSLHILRNKAKES